MNVLIVGCQRVGRKLVQMLEHLGHDVSVLDPDVQNLEQLSALTPPFTGMAVTGVPIDVDALRSAGIEDCEAVAAVTRDDNVNIMVTQIAQSVFGVKNVIARITDPGTKEVYSRQFAMPSVCSTNLTAMAILAKLLHEGVEESQSVTFGSSSVGFSTRPVAQSEVGALLRQTPCPRAGVYVFGVLHANGTAQLAPDTVLQKDDKIIFSELAD